MVVGCAGRYAQWSISPIRFARQQISRSAADRGCWLSAEAGEMQQFLGCNAEPIANTINIIWARVKTPVGSRVRRAQLSHWEVRTERRDWSALLDAGGSGLDGFWVDADHTVNRKPEVGVPRRRPSGRASHATRSLAIDPDLDLPLTVISMSRPSTSRSRIRRSIEKPDSLPCLRADTLG